MPGQELLTDGPKRILVVDDNEISRKVIQYRLEKDGYEVVAASGGVQALEIVADGPVDLVFLDLIMEDIGGMEVLERLKADQRQADIPVVVVSGIEDVDAAANCLAAGAVDFLPKPVKAATLIEIVTDLLGDRTAGNAPSAPEPDPEQSLVFDPKSINQLVTDFGAETAAGFVARFQMLAPGQLEAIEEASESGFEEWRRAATTLKGGARTLGLLRLTVACRLVERACADGRSEDAARATGKLIDHLGQSLDALDEHPTGA